MQIFGINYRGVNSFLNPWGLTMAGLGHFCPFIICMQKSVEMSCFTIQIIICTHNTSFKNMKIDEYLPRFNLIKISFPVHFLACTTHYPMVPLKFVNFNSTETSLNILTQICVPKLAQMKVLIFFLKCLISKI